MTMAHVPARTLSLVPDRRLHEEIVNSVTHGLGFALSLALVGPFILAPATRGDLLTLIGVSIYCAALVATFAASTLYHGVQDPVRKRFFQRMDYVCIYLLIAGTYTPFTLTLLRGFWGWTMLALVWSFAVVGIAAKLELVPRLNHASAAPYVLMGWLAVLAIKPCLEMLPGSCMIWLLAGGLSYTAGVIFYAWDRPYDHAIWHLFVLVGGGCHFIAVANYVVPA